MSNCINIIKISINLNKKGFIIKNNSKNLNLIKAFLKINIIKFVKISDDKKKLIVFLNYFNNKPIFYNIINMMKYSNKKFISLKCLKDLSLKHNWILILSTNKGILNSYEAIKLNTGGLVLAEIWN